MAHSGDVFTQFLLIVIINDLNCIWWFQYSPEVARYFTSDFGLTNNNNLSVALLTDDDTVVFSYSKELNLLIEADVLLRSPLIFVNWRVSTQSHIFPEHESALSGSCNKWSSPWVIDDAGDLISTQVDSTVIITAQNIKNRQVVCLVLLQMPESYHVLVWAGR